MNAGSTAPSRVAIGALAVPGALVALWPVQSLLVALLIGVVVSRWPANSLSRRVAAGWHSLGRGIRVPSEEAWLRHAPTVLTACLIGCFAVIRAPGDDLLRHVVAYQVGFDWPSHYGHHSLAHHWSWWFGFEWLAGAIHVATGENLRLTIGTIRVVVAALVLVPVACAVRRAAPGQPLLQLIGIGLIALLLGSRLAMGRPEVLMVGVLAAASCMPRAAWLVFALVLSPAYWFSPSFAVACALFPLRTRRDWWASGITAVVYAGLATAWWVGYAGTEYFEIPSVQSVFLASNRALGDGELVTQELFPLGYLLWSMPALLVLCGVAALIWRGCLSGLSVPRSLQVVSLIALAAFYSLPDMIRYGPAILVLLVLACVSLADGMQVPTSWNRAATALTMLFCVSVVQTTLGQGTVGWNALSPGRIDLRDAERVLAGFDSTAYIATVTNPQTIVTPTHEIGAVAPDMQRVVVALGRGVPPTCAVLQANFDALIESTLKGPVPACLRLRSFAENLRVWDVEPRQR